MMHTYPDIPSLNKQVQSATSKRKEMATFQSAGITN